MIPQAYITAWRKKAPWQEDFQVEQDLVIERCIHALDIDQCKTLLHTSSALDISSERQRIIFEKKLQHFEELHPDFIQVVAKRSDELVNAHTRFAKYIGAKRFEAVTPVLPPDILGVYCINS